MKKLLTIVTVLLCLGATAQTTVSDTTVVRTPLVVAVGAGAIYDTLTMPAATTAVNGFMTAASMTNIANLQTSMATANSNIATLQTTVAGISGTLAANVQAGNTYTLVPGDNSRVVIMSSVGTSTLTLPTGLADGFVCRVLQQGGVITFAAGAGATIVSPFSYRRSQTQWGIITVICLGSNRFSLSGNLKQ